MKKGTLLATIGSIIILIISFIAFVLPSTLGYITPDKIDYGNYNGKQFIFEKGSDLYNNSYGSEQYISYGLEMTLKQYAFEDMAKQSGYIAPTATINKIIKESFLDDKGNFSKTLLRDADKNTIDSLRKSAAQQITLDVVKDDLLINTEYNYKTKSIFGNKISDNEFNYYNDLNSNRRAFNLASFSKEEFPQSKIIEWGENNKSKFNIYDYSIVTFNTEKLATKYADQLAKSEITFENLILNSDNLGQIAVQETGKATYKTRYKIENLLTNKSDISIFDELKVGETSRPISMNGFFAIIKMDSDIASIDLTNPDDITTVKTYIFTYENTMIEDYYIALAKEFKEEANNTSFDKACAKYGIKKEEVPAFSINYGGSPLINESVDTSIPSLSQVSTNENFFKTAFSLKKNEISEPILTTNKDSLGYIIILQYTNDGSQNDDTTVARSLQEKVIANNDNSTIYTHILNDSKTHIVY